MANTINVGGIEFELSFDSSKLESTINATCNKIKNKFAESFNSSKMTSAVNTACNNVKNKFEESFTQAGNSATRAMSASNEKIKEILSDTEKDAESKAASITAIYSAEGDAQEEAFKKAWSNIEKESSSSTEKVKKNFSSISKSAKNSANSSQQSFEKSFEKIASKATSAAKKIATALAAAFSLGKIIDFAKECIELGSDLQEVQNVVDVTFSSMSAQVDQFAKSAAASFGLSETMAKQYTGTFGAMAKAFGFTESAAYEMSTTLTGLAGDVASFYNITQDEAYTKLKSVFTGETESLKDLGVVMTQNALDQYALANGYGKTTSAMTEQEKVALRYNFVMEQLSAAQGDFARTSDSWANQCKILSLQLQSIMATVGQGLINLFTPVIKIINTVLGKVAQLAEGFKGLTELLTGKSSTSGSGISDTLTSGLSDVSTSADDATSSLADATDSADSLADSTEAAGDAAEAAAKQLMGFDEINKLSDQSTSSDSGTGSGGSTGSTGDIDSALDGLGSSATDFGQLAEGETVIDNLSESLEKLLEFISPTTDAIKKLYDEGLSKLMDFTWATLQDFWENFLKPIGTWYIRDDSGLPRFFNITNDLLNEIDWDRLQRALADFYTSLQEPTKFVWTGLMDFYESFLKPIATWTMSEGIPRLVQELTKFNTNVDWTKLNSSLNALWQALSRLVVGIGQGAIDFIDNFNISEGLASTVNLFASALNVFANVIAKIPESVLQAVGAGLTVVATAIGAYKAYTTVGNILTKIGAGLDKFVAAATAHPLLTIAAGVAALAAALITYANIKYTENKYGAFADDIETLSDTLDEYSSNIKTKLKNIDKTIASSGLAESQQIKDLWAEYEILEEKVGKSIDEQERMKEIAAMMAEICPEINDYIDTQTGLFTDQKDEIEELIAQTEEYYKKQAAQSLMTEAYEAQAEALLALKEAQSELNTISDEYNTLLAEYQAEMAKTDGTISPAKLQDLYDQMVQCSNAQTAVNDAAAEANLLYEESTAKIGTLTEYMGGISTAADTIDLRNAVINTAEAIDEMDGILVNGVQVVGADAIEIYNAFADELDKAPDYCYTTGDGMMIQLGKGVDDSSYVPLSTLSSVLTASDEEMKSWNESWEENGKQAIAGYTAGMESEKENVGTKAEEIFANMRSRFQSVAEIQSPSKKTAEDGDNIILGLVSGVERSVYLIQTLMESLPDTMVSALGDLAATFAISGALIPAGMLAGFAVPWLVTLATFKSIPQQIQDAIGDLSSIGRNAAQSLANGFRSVHIPSPQFTVSTVAASAAGVGFSLPKVNVSWLAQGGFVEKNTPQLAMIGDNRHQGEIVAPEDKLLEMAERAASSGGSPDLLQKIINLLETLISLVQGGDDIVLAINDEELARAVMTGTLKLKRRYTTVEVTV